MNAPQFPIRDRIAGCRVLLVGNVMLDRYWHGEVARISLEASVPVVHIQREESRLGAMAWANKAVGLVVVKFDTALLTYDELLA